MESAFSESRIKTETDCGLIVSGFERVAQLRFVNDHEVNKGSHFDEKKGIECFEVKSLTKISRS